MPDRPPLPPGAIPINRTDLATLLAISTGADSLRAIADQIDRCPMSVHRSVAKLRRAGVLPAAGRYQAGTLGRLDAKHVPPPGDGDA